MLCDVRVPLHAYVCMCLKDIANPHETDIITDFPSPQITVTFMVVEMIVI